MVTASPCCRLCPRARRLAAQGSDRRRRRLSRWTAVSNETAERTVWLKGPAEKGLPLSLITHDLWHVFYQNQMQINGGRNDMLVAWADSAALVGRYANASYDLAQWGLASEHVLCENFFQGAFGGWFFNHQYLAAATPPRYPNRRESIAKFQLRRPLAGDLTIRI